MKISKEDLIEAGEGLIKNYEKMMKEVDELLNRFQKILTDGYDEDGIPLTAETRKFYQDSINNLKDL